MSDLIPIERIERKIIVIRDQRVLLDSALAELYGVETGALVRAVKRNIERFPYEFMFQLDNKEFAFLKCQTGISNTGRGGRRTSPYAFTEQGVAMLSSVLRSKTAIQINIAIMNTFVQMRKMIKNDELTKARLDDLEDRLGANEFQTMMVLDQLGAIKKKLKSAELNKPLIGFPISKNKEN